MTHAEAISGMLGGRAGVRRTVSSHLELAEAVRRGLAPKALEAVKRELGLTDLQIAAALAVSLKTIGRIRKSPRRHLDALVSDRLYRLARLMALATGVFEDKDAAREWLRSPQVGLAGKVPLDVAQTEAGAREVEELLGRIEHGVLA